MRGPILVTGAAGFAGSHLLDLLTGQGLDVVAWSRPGGSPPSSASRTTWQAVDLLDGGAVRRALARVEPAIVYHLAGAPHVGRSWANARSTVETNVRTTHHLVEGLRDIRAAARVLLPSSGMVYAPSSRPLTEDDPVEASSPYGLSKIAQELVGVGNPEGPVVVIARPFNHVGPRQDPSFVASGFAERIARIEREDVEPELSVGNLTPARDLTDVRDTVRAYQAIAERGEPGRVYNVCSGRGVVIRDLLDQLLARARVPIRVSVDPARYRPNDLPLVVGDPSRIHHELGWTTKIPLGRTLDDLLAYWRERLGTPAAS